MFFSISKNNFDEKFVNFTQVNDFYISCDEGWTEINYNQKTIFYKGYCDEKPIDQVILELAENCTPKYNGNFCAIIVDDNSATITHDLNRSFPLCSYGNTLTNFYDDKNNAEERKDIWSDTFATLTNNIRLTTFDNLYSELDFSKTLSFEECTDELVSLLNTKTAQLKRFTQPINAFLSGGVDTMLAYALAQDTLDDNQYDLITYEHHDLTQFIAKNDQEIKNTFWGYRQIHHWKQPTVLLSGACGDEVFMRGPTTIAMWCAWHNYNVIEMLNELGHCFHKKYFLKPKNKAIFQQHWGFRKDIQKYSLDELKSEIVNNIVNDHQHWHLGNTTTWTPFNDIRILRIMLQLSPEDLLHQILHGSLSKAIIAKFDAELNDYICVDKNVNQFHNLLNYEKYQKSLENS